MTGHTTGSKYKDGKLTKLLGAAEPSVYNQQHSWALFSSLALSMAQRLSQHKPGVCVCGEGGDCVQFVGTHFVNSSLVNSIDYTQINQVGMNDRRGYSIAKDAYCDTVLSSVLALQHYGTAHV